MHFMSCVCQRLPNPVQSLHASKISRFYRHEHFERLKHDTPEIMEIRRHSAEPLSAQGRSLIQSSLRLAMTT